MATNAMTSLHCGVPTLNLQQKRHLIPTKLFHHSMIRKNDLRTRNLMQKRGVNVVRSQISLGDFIGGDLLKLDLGTWLSDVEEHKALAIYTPHEGGYEGRYLNRLRYQGYHFLDVSARGLGDVEATLTKVHPVCPAHVGKQPIARWWFPPEIDYRLEALPADAKGLIVWVIEAKVLSKSELQFLALLPSLRPNVRVIAECGNWRKFMWKPLKEIAGLAPLREP
ncbi:unnamed protein product [Amaranthus hypochondriacus]